MRFPEKYRMIKPGRYCSKPGDTHGMFYIPRREGAPLKVMANNITEEERRTLFPPYYEHVSVSLPTRCPTWREMCLVKFLFWEDHELVVQFHPPKSEHINVHPYCLHLWKPVDFDIPLPDALTVGLKR